MARLMKYVEIEQHDAPKKVDDFIAWLSDLASHCGVARDEITVEFKADYGSDYCWLNICYSRPETDAEMQIREKREREAHERSERAERERYEFLKAKFEGSE